MSDMEQKRAYKEVLMILNALHLNNFVPENILTTMQREQDESWEFEINPELPMEEQDILNRSAALLSVIYIKYICDDENEKQELKALYEKNEEFNHVDYNSIIASIVADGNGVDIKKEETLKPEVSNLPIKRESVWEKIRNFFRKLLRKK
ncbi:MAG: hypothetical protein IJO08_04295 [Clostridia bacterium]|nr:hypothetical protein [Clostridia bacterium]